MSQAEHSRTTTSIVALAEELARAMDLNTQLDDRCTAILDMHSPEYLATEAAFEANEERMNDLGSRLSELPARTPS